MKSSPFLVAVLLIVLPRSLPAAPAPAAADPDSWCGSEASALVISAARHQQFQRRLARQRRSAAAVGWPPEAPFNVYQYQEIAVIEDNGTLVSDPNPFDLTDGAIQFLRRPRGAMSAVRFTPGIKTPLGDRLPLGEDDAIEVEFPQDFQFPFGEAVYRSVFVNSNGDLTFGARDSGSFEA
ncbi:MAG: hypothetical protein GY856_05920, partial [bacterium]|nr:hypothetical protein [bacterium]